MSDTSDKIAPWPVNCWYAAGWSGDIGRDPLARTICNHPIVFYRTLDGTPVALEDACMHRLLPLSMGHLEGDDIVCGYHGMTFDCSGRCVRMPIPSEPVSRAAGVPAYPVVERHKLVWVWIGDPGRADAALIPDLHWADDPEWAAAGAQLDLACDYRLVVDNLMDLTHEAFVHKSSIGHATITEAPFEVSRDGDKVTLTRWMIDTDAPPFLAMQLKAARDAGPDHVDRWQIIHFTAPGTVDIDVGVAPTGTGAPQGDRSKGISGRVLNTMTPQSDKRCYYFFAFARSYDTDNEELNDRIRSAVFNIFGEDQIVLERQQSMIERMPDRKLLNLSIDKASLWARRAIDKMTVAEKAAEEI